VGGYTGRERPRPARLKPVELSCKTEYALLALLALTGRYRQQEPLQIRQIAAQQGIPERYLEQLLATLRRGGFVRSQRGAKGGYLLAQEPDCIALLDVIDCLEGSESQATDGAAHQTVERAVVAEVWKDVYASAKTVLRQYTLQDLSDWRDAKAQPNLMYYI